MKIYNSSDNIREVESNCNYIKQNNNRNFGIDLLRIIMMFLIVLRHGSYQSGAISIANIPKMNYLIGIVIANISGIAVNCYIIISGYFLCKQKIRFERIFNLYITIIFYSLNIALIALILPNFHISKKILFHAIFPLCTGFSWFMSYYIVLSIISPFINKTLSILTKEQFFFLLGILLFFFSLIPSFGLSTFSQVGGYTFIWFVVLYCTGAYLRFHGKESSIYKNLIGYISFCLLTFVCLLLRFILKKRGIILVHPDNYDFLPTFLTSVFCFKIFLNMKLPACVHGLIARISPLMLGCYLFHDHDLKHELWGKLLVIQKHINDNLWLWHMLACVCAVFILGCIFEYIRQLLCRKILCSLKNKKLSKWISDLNL